MPRRRPSTISARVTMEEKGDVQAAAADVGVPVAEFIHGMVVPEAKRILTQSLRASTLEEPLAPTPPAEESP